MNTAIILGAGKGTRMRAQVNKQFLFLNGKSILNHTLEVFDNNSLIQEMILVINPLEEEIIMEKVLKSQSFTKPLKIIYGGKERQESVFNGLSAVDIDTTIVLIHDGARPLVTDEIINRCIVETEKYGAVTTGVQAKETIKIVNDDNFVDHTPKRENLWITQTPQAFNKDTIMMAHMEALKRKILGTDDAMLVEMIGKQVKMVIGDYENIKITTPEDLVTAEGILKFRSLDT